MLRLGTAFVSSQLPKPIPRNRDLEKTTVSRSVKNVHSFCGNLSLTPDTEPHHVRNPDVGDRIILNVCYRCPFGPGSSVGIATGYGLDGPGIKSRWGTRFSAPVQTGPGACLASCTMGTGSFPGVKSGRGVTLTPHPLLVQW